ncbi:putative AC transposase [Bienertia sinuspersici]
MSRMGKDVFVVPITSIVAESSFNMGGKVLTKHRSSLGTDNFEAFVKNQNWLFGYLKDDEVQDWFEVMKEVMLDDVDHDSLPQIRFVPIFFSYYFSKLITNLIFLT